MHQYNFEFHRGCLFYSHDEGKQTLSMREILLCSFFFKHLYLSPATPNIQQYSNSTDAFCSLSLSRLPKFERGVRALANIRSSQKEMKKIFLRENKKKDRHATYKTHLHTSLPPSPDSHHNVQKRLCFSSPLSPPRHHRHRRFKPSSEFDIYTAPKPGGRNHPRPRRGPPLSLLFRFDDDGLIFFTATATATAIS